jgi:hypothetical protein
MEEALEDWMERSWELKRWVNWGKRGVTGNRTALVLSIDKNDNVNVCQNLRTPGRVNILRSTNGYGRNWVERSG